MKWSKSKVVSLAGAASLLITAVLFAGPYKEKAGFIFNWFIDGVKYMELDTTGLKADNISDLAGTGSPDFTNGLNLSSEPTLVAEYMTATTATTSPAAAGTFHSEIIGRQPMLDLRKVPSGKFGIERFTLRSNSISVVEGESGPSGETVYRINTDPLDRFRLYGPALSQLTTDRGFYISNDFGFAEVTCYCTGLNILGADADGIRVAAARTDGGSETANFMPTGSTSTVLNAREYQSNLVFNARNSEALGIHTFRLRGDNWLRAYGFEILNEATTVAIPAGSIVDNGRKYTTTATTDDLTTFANHYQDGISTTAKTVGGNQVRYFDTDGTIKKDINYADSAVGTIGGADVDHSNEEVVQRFNWREFGAGRADDFSTLSTSGSDRAFTLDDGTTTLVGDNVLAGTANNVSTLVIGGIGDFLTLTFVGAGLDIIETGTTAGANNTEVFIDGASIGTYAPAGSVKTTSIVSGLPFGTHTARIKLNGGTATNPNVSDFIIYAPKKPVLADGQVEIDSTYKMADFVANTTAGSTQVSQGVLRKDATRELVYNGTWNAVQGGAAFVGYWRLWSSTPGVDFRYSFFGTGWCWRGEFGGSQSNSVLVEVDDGTGFQTLNTTNYPSIVSTTSAGSGFNISTGTMDTSPAGGNGSEITVTGMPLGHYVIRFTEQGSGADDLSVDAFDIITPTYSYKNNLLNLDDAIVGSNSLKNEILVPGATKHKIIATEGIDVPTITGVDTITGNAATDFPNGITLPTGSVVFNETTGTFGGNNIGKPTYTGRVIDPGPGVYLWTVDTGLYRLQQSNSGGVAVEFQGGVVSKSVSDGVKNPQAGTHAGTIQSNAWHTWSTVNHTGVGLYSNGGGGGYLQGASTISGIIQVGENEKLLLQLYVPSTVGFAQAETTIGFPRVKIVRLVQNP